MTLAYAFYLARWASFILTWWTALSIVAMIAHHALRTMYPAR